MLRYKLVSFKIHVCIHSRVTDVCITYWMTLVCLLELLSCSDLKAIGMELIDLHKVFESGESKT